MKYFLISISVLFCINTAYGNILVNDEIYYSLSVSVNESYKRKGEIEVKVLIKNFSEENIKVISPLTRITSGAFKLEAFSKSSKNYSEKTIFSEVDEWDYDYIELKPSEFKTITVKLPINYPLKATFLKISYYPTKKDNVITAPVFLKFISLKK